MKIVKRRDGSAVQIITEAVYQEQNQIMVVYQELKDPFSIFALEQEKFWHMMDGMDAGYPHSGEETAVFEGRSENDNGVMDEQAEEKRHASLIEEFLDAETYHKKIEILEGQEEQIPEETMELLALTLDVVLEGNTMETKYYSLMQVLRTRARFEVER
ncbi:MAG: hypothetical protein Q4E73_02510 [Lachnospiraceae bacterium]|nr:hypothetical protein [Lachnospiraceae bacterium]